jgi:hypothetical protein
LKQCALIGKGREVIDHVDNIFSICYWAFRLWKSKITKYFGGTVLVFLLFWFKYMFSFVTFEEFYGWLFGNAILCCVVYR